MKCQKIRINKQYIHVCPGYFYSLNDGCTSEIFKNVKNLFEINSDLRFCVSGPSAKGPGDNNFAFEILEYKF